MKQRLLVWALILFILSLGFNALLNFISIEKLYVQSTVSKYEIIGKDIRQKLGYFSPQLKSGEGLESINSLLQEGKQILQMNMTMNGQRSHEGNPATVASYDPSISIALPKGTIIASSDRRLINQDLPREIGVAFSKNNPAEQDTYHTKLDNIHFLGIPIIDSNKHRVADIIISFDDKPIKAYKQSLFKDNQIPITMILICGMLVLFLSLYAIIPIDGKEAVFPKKKITVYICLTIGIAQIAFSGMITLAFKNHYLEINRDKARIAAGLVRKASEAAWKEESQLSSHPGMEDLMGGIINANSELSDMTVYDNQWHPLFMATGKGAINCQDATYAQLKEMKESLPQWNPKYSVRLTLSKGNEIAGYISTNISKKTLFDRLFDIAMDTFTVLFISLIFFVEMLFLIFNFVEKKSVEIQQPKPVHYTFIRPVFFLLMLGLDFTISFVPLHMEKLYEPMFGLSKDVVLSLPVSLGVFFTGLGFFIAGVWNDKKGWHEPFLWGVFLAGLGNVYSWLAPNAMNFIIAQSLVGLGFGLAFMATQGFIMAYTDKNTKAHGFAILFAALFAGGFCGSSTGAMLAERIGYAPVFLVGGLIIFSTILYTLLFMKDAIQKPASASKAAAKDPSPGLNLKEILRYLCRRNVITVILFSSIPANMAMIGFLNYFNPVYLNRIGVSQSNIGRTFMIYCALAIYIGPWISRYIDSSENKKAYMIFGGLLGAMAFIVFHFFDGLTASVVAIILLGLCNSFVFVAQAAYLLKLKSTHDVGQGKAIAAYRLANRLGQVIGPLTFGWLVVATEIKMGMTYIGLVYIGLTVMFLLFAQSDKKIAPVERIDEVELTNDKKHALANRSRGDAVTDPVPDSVASAKEPASSACD